MFSEKFGHFFDKPLQPLARRITIHPNVLTLIGFLITLVASVVIPFYLKIGGLFILIGGFFDLLDGAVARSNNTSTDFGAFLDSTLDRFSDFFIFFGIGCYFANISNLEGIIVTSGSLLGAFMISYIRARAEGIGIKCNVGLMERPERIIIISVGCLTGLIFYAMILLFLLTYLTVLQRLVHVYKSV